MSDVDKASIIKDIQELHLLQTTPLVKIKAHVVNRMSIRSLKARGWISSEVINCFCELMTFHSRNNINNQGIKVQYLMTWYQGDTSLCFRHLFCMIIASLFMIIACLIAEKCGRLTNSTKVFKCVTEDDYGGDIDACEKVKYLTNSYMQSI